MTKNIVWAICVTLIMLGFMASLVVLSALKVDTTEFSRFINTVLNAAAPLLAGGALIRANQAANQTNGGLDARIHKQSLSAVNKALDERGA